MRKYLKQITSGEIYVWTKELASRPDMVPFIGSMTEEQDVTTQDIKTIQSDVVRFHLTAHGLGDAVTGLYAACGVASAGYKVEFYTKFDAWLKAEHPNLTILSGAEGFDANANYSNQLREARLTGVTRPEYYVRNLTRAYGLRSCAPVRPDIIHTVSAPLSGSYALLAPYSNGSHRMWGTEHYRRVAVGLLKQGKTVVVMTDLKNSEMTQTMFYGLPVTVACNLTPEEAIGYVSGADILICNDSGPAHLGGLYGKRTLVLLAPYTKEYLFHCGENIEAITPVTSCVSCFSQDNAGWDQVCNIRCSALQTIRPDEVLLKAITV